ncbi:Bifunctional (p)ppGpp synthase/hydrolase SpoT [BD1-7 clade bacterium]|uniref:guanosine-3',5'-bis(diphosphate) 3'-diphosphatase n=1 Tax=BD1-7 clade bacterium TaxID=2029982 RepID=A0A5S9MZA7_9GAMM|nr:Bifunctional (p)ppGpp synthase/hydrolase SpoT [BD1-7 clade bacterium]
MASEPASDAPMLTILTLCDKISSYLSDEQVRQVKRAYYFAEQAHESQRRRSGEPYVIHPLAVANILSDMHMDHESLQAAMLHDVLEDTGVSKSALSRQFGESVTELVDGVSKLTQMDFDTKAEAQAENFQKMAMAMARDIRVIMVKLADRTHNMRTLGALKPEKRRRISKETLEIYAPIANRLGMNNMRIELEDLCFFGMYPMRASRIQAAVKSVRGKREELIEESRFIINEHLHEDKLEARVSGREKHLYSIYQKMKSSRKSFKDIMDVFGFRIIVDKVDTCYRVLGAMHALFKPVPGQFKDYIAIPKSNGYQSLHTILIGRHGVPIEVQIRTEEMEDMANNGIAAHWLYKQGNDYSSAVSGSHKRARQWVQGLLEIQERTGNSLEFIENVKIDLFPDEVYVFTPKGRILELPQGATAIDFAYALHTDLGSHCVGCYINRRLSSLSEPLQSGQTVEIITSINAQPNPVWLDFVVTGKARSNIRHVLKNHRHSESVALGERLLNKSLVSLGASLDEITEEQIDNLLQSTGHKNFDYVLEDIGIGNRVAYLTARQLLSEEHHEEATSAVTPALAQQTDLDDNQKALIISGTEGMMVNFAKCCHPLPGDSIVGHMSVGRGVVVHTNQCAHAEDIRRKHKAIELRWNVETKGEFVVPLCVEIKHQRGLIATLANKINSLDTNIESINAYDVDAYNSRVDIEISVKDRVHLARIMRHIRNIKSVTRISRVKSTQTKRNIP